MGENSIWLVTSGAFSRDARRSNRVAEKLLRRIGVRDAVGVGGVERRDAAVEQEAQEIGELGRRLELLLRAHRAPDDAGELRPLRVHPDARNGSGIGGHQSSSSSG